MEQWEDTPIELDQPMATIDAQYTVAVQNQLSRRRIELDRCLAELEINGANIGDIIARLINALQTGHKVLVAGNGGSAAEAQHLASELVGRFQHERAPYAVMSLTTDTSTLTAVANDYGYEHVFARQISAFGQPGDVLVIFSTSGTSPNVLRAAEAAREQGMIVISLTGDRPSPLMLQSDITVRVPLSETAAVQEVHAILVHVICSIVESELAGINWSDD